MKLYILFAIIGSAFAAPSSRIVGGSDVSINEYPYLTSLHNGFGGMWVFFCGGSLITTNAVLSAAHCVVFTSASEWQVRLGSSYFASGGSVHYISQLIIHDQFTGLTPRADLTILRLATNAVISLTVAPVPIAGPNYDVPVGTPVYSAGWGRLWYFGPNPDYLQHVQVNVIDHDTCAERYAFLKTQPGYAFYFDVLDDSICAGILNIGGKSVCEGDSGGPLSHRNGMTDVVVGVTSWGVDCAHPFYPAVQIRVSHYTDWIVANASS